MLKAGGADIQSYRVAKNLVDAPPNKLIKLIKIFTEPEMQKNPDFKRFRYSNSVLNYAESMRVLVQQTFFRAGGGNIVNYLALVLTKLKTEKARKRARSGEDYFNTKLPVSCIKKLEKALHMCLIINEIEPLDVQESISMLGRPAPF